jgi:hypothetical protein
MMFSSKYYIQHVVLVLLLIFIPYVLLTSALQAVLLMLYLIMYSATSYKEFRQWEKRQRVYMGRILALNLISALTVVPVVVWYKSGFSMVFNPEWGFMYIGIYITLLLIAVGTLKELWQAQKIEVKPKTENVKR